MNNDNAVVPVTVKPKVRRPGSGRTTGSYSFVSVTLEDLNNKFADKSTPIVIGRKWAEMVSIKGKPAAPAGKIMDKIEGTTEETKPQVKVRDFDADEE